MYFKTLLFFLLTTHVMLAQENELDQYQKSDLELIKDIGEKLDRYVPKKVTELTDRNLYMVNAEAEVWMRISVSEQERERWFRYRFMSASTKQIFENAFNTLSKSVQRNISRHLPDAAYFAVRSKAEETVMRSALPTNDQLRIHKIGLIHKEWQPNGDGRPFKKGYVWATDRSGGKAICYVYSVLVTKNVSYVGDQKIGDETLEAEVLDQMVMGCPGL